MKKLFDTPKKAVISMICIVAAIAAIGTIAVKSTLIGKAEAKNIALRDAGINEAEASALRAKLEFDDGRFQYEVDFYNNGTEYEYFIQGKDGDIIARDIDGGPNGNKYEQSQPADSENQPAANTGNSVQSQEIPQEISQEIPQEISVEEAKAAALEDAGLSEADVRFVKAELDNDDGKMEYEIEFYSGRTEYDYTIDAVSGNIIEHDIDYN